MKKKRYRIGMIGYGGYGRFLIESWQELPEVEIRAVAGRNPERLKQTAERYHIPQIYIGAEALLQDPEIDIVVIATPPHQHSPEAVAAARAKKAIYCEKPLATSLKEGEKVAEAVAHHQVPFVMGYVMRYHPLFERLKQLVESQMLGELRRIDFSNTAADENLPPHHWLWDFSQSGGIFIEHGVHFFDIYSWLAQSEVTRISAHITFRPETRQADRYIATLEYQSGLIATFFHSFDKPERLERTFCHLIFDLGYLTLQGWIPTGLEMEIGLAERDRPFLQSLFPGFTEKVVLPSPEDKRLWRGRGRTFQVDQILKGEWQIGQTKQELYKKCVQDSLKDLLQALEDPSHRVRAGILEGLNSLKIAEMATQQALKGVS